MTNIYRVGSLLVRLGCMGLFGVFFILFPEVQLIPNLSYLA